MITMTDSFCGVGGSSTGAVAVPGVRVALALNHWDLAIRSHNANHPDTDHDVADLSRVDPARYPSTDIGWFSPECTTWSQARGQARDFTSGQDELALFDAPLPDEATQRSRSTMGDVVRFTRHHAYRAVIVENVVDIRRWHLFDAWVAQLRGLGYDHAEVYLNSMHAQAGGPPAPQSRDRLYVVLWRTGQRAPDLGKWLRPRATCGRHGPVSAVQSWKDQAKRAGRYRQQYLYRCPRVECRNTVVEPGWLPAAAAIDWTIRGQRIADRDRPLAAKTRARIAAGIARYGRAVHLEAAGHTYDTADPRHPQHRTPDGYLRVWPVDEPLRTLHTTESKGLAVAPMLVPAGGSWNDTAHTVADPMRTRTATEHEALACPPFLAELRGGGSDARPVTDPLATIVAAGNHHGLVYPPLVMRNNTARGDAGQMVSPAGEVLRTLTTTGHQSLLVPYHRTGAARPTTAPMPTITTIDPAALLTPGQAAAAVDDCEFRMLQPHEIGAGMAFPAAYICYGTQRERVKQYGNAVTPPAARDLIAAVVEAITGDHLDPARWDG